MIDFKKVVLVAWSKCWCPSEEGGLAVKSIVQFIVNLLEKLTWNLLINKFSFVFKFLREHQVAWEIISYLELLNLGWLYDALQIL